MKFINTIIRMIIGIFLGLILYCIAKFNNPTDAMIIGLALILANQYIPPYEEK